MQIEQLTAEAMTDDIEALADILHACVLDGASIGFVLPFAPAEAARFWRKVQAEVADGGTRMFVARQPGRLVGCVLLQLAAKPNQRHRADVAKLLVHPSARRQGLGRALMQAAEACARRERRTLLNLDTRTGDASEALYRSLGFELMGIAPGYARHPVADALEDCSFMFKRLA